MDFSLSDAAIKRRDLMRMAAEHLMRPIARQFDEEEHTDPWDFFNAMWEASKSNRKATSITGSEDEKGDGKSGETRSRNESVLLSAVQIEELAWGDAGLYLSIPNPGLGGAAVSAAGTSEQKQRWLADFHEGKPRWAAMAITEPPSGAVFKHYGAGPIAR
jgi:acyl-CoA dehydrogenase